MEDITPIKVQGSPRYTHKNDNRNEDWGQQKSKSRPINLFILINRKWSEFLISIPILKLIIKRFL